MTYYNEHIFHITIQALISQCIRGSPGLSISINWTWLCIPPILCVEGNNYTSHKPFMSYCADHQTFLPEPSHPWLFSFSSIHTLLYTVFYFFHTVPYVHACLWIILFWKSNHQEKLPLYANCLKVLSILIYSIHLINSLWISDCTGKMSRWWFFFKLPTQSAFFIIFSFKNSET